MVPNTEVVVGDLMFLDTGDKIIADGIVVDAQVRVCVAAAAAAVEALQPQLCRCGSSNYLSPSSPAAVLPDRIYRCARRACTLDVLSPPTGVTQTRARACMEAHRALLC